MGSFNGHTKKSSGHSIHPNYRITISICEHADPESLLSNEPTAQLFSDKTKNGEKELIKLVSGVECSPSQTGCRYLR